MRAEMGLIQGEVCVGPDLCFGFLYSIWFSLLKKSGGLCRQKSRAPALPPSRSQFV
jgi:hypothetical protein